MGSMFSAPTPPPPVKPKAPAPMPDEMSPAALEARRKKQVADLGRVGRTGTILTGEADRGGTATLGA